MRNPPFFIWVLRRILKSGAMTVIDAHGRAHHVGRGAASECTMRLTDPWLHLRLLLDPEMWLGRAYMDGRLIMEKGTIVDLLTLLQRNVGTGVGAGAGPHKLLQALRRLLRRGAQWNPIGRSRKNVEHHYDVPEAVYRAFLDEDLQYSCAYFKSPRDTLEMAQERKKRHIAAKLLLKEGQSVLDIGSGWGGLGLYLARQSGARVTGVTLSGNQLKVSRERAARMGLGSLVQFRLQDYRQITERFDRIVSVGMLEHVGVPHLQAYFDTVARLLGDRGVALIHTIGRTDGPGITNPWIARYIFPGGYIPSLSELMPAVEKAGLVLTDVEVLRLHYAETLKRWRERFEAAAPRLEKDMGAEFIRMWRFYLAASEMGFRHQGLVVFQLQLAKAIDSVPTIRDYMLDWERAQEDAEADLRKPAMVAG